MGGNIAALTLQVMAGHGVRDGRAAWFETPLKRAGSSP
jgi:hypothetical protein